MSRKPIRGVVQNIPLDTCLLCSAPTTLIDVLDIPWCGSHAYRGICLNWAYERDWPRLSCKPEEVFEISNDVSAWKLNMVFADDYRAGFIAAYIDYYGLEPAYEEGA